MRQGFIPVLLLVLLALLWPSSARDLVMLGSAVCVGAMLGFQAGRAGEHFGGPRLADGSVQGEISRTKMGAVDLISSANSGEKLMVDTIKTGTILIKEGTQLPGGLQLESETYSRGWRLVKNLDGSGLDRKLCEARWTFFYMAEEVNAVAVGFDLEKMTRRAVKRVLASMKSDKLNCLEIKQVAAGRFLGLPYVTVIVRPRHIQESVFLFHAKRLAEWDHAKLVAA